MTGIEIRPSVTVGLVPRNCFCLTGMASPRLFEHSETSVSLNVADSDISWIFRERMKPVVYGCDNVNLGPTNFS